MSSMFVRLSSPLYIHTCTHTSSFATNTATSFICYRKKKKKKQPGKKEKKENEKREKKDIEEKKAVVLSFLLSYSSVLFLVPCFTVFCCAGCHGHQEQHRHCSPLLASSSSVAASYSRNTD